MKFDIIKSLFFRIINNDTARFSGITLACLFYYLVYQSVILDDAFIYFRIVKNLIEMGKPVFNIGDTSFVATSPLWVVILAASKVILPFFTLELIAKLWWAILLTAASTFAYFTFSPFIGKWAVFAACPFFLSPVIGSMTGNEIALLYLALFGLIWACIFQKPIYSGIFLGIGYLARGEFVLAVIPLFLYFIFNKNRQNPESKYIIADLIKISAAAFFFAAPWHSYYFMTFHNFFPTTFSIKMLQGQSGQWILFHQVIFVSLYPLLSGRLYLLILTVIGVWKQPYLFRFMAIYTLFHTVLYTILKIPYYHWYYYDYDIFVLFLTLFGVFSVIEMGNSFMTQLAQSKQLSWMAREMPQRMMSAIILVSLFALIFPMRFELFLPNHFSGIYQNNHTDRRYNSYEEVSNQLQKVVRPNDIILADEVGIISYFLQNQEIRDTNGLASPNTTVSNMNDWSYFIDYYKPQFIILRGKPALDKTRSYKFNDSTYIYERYSIIPETETYLVTSIFIRVTP